METKKSGIINKEQMRGIDWQIYEKLDDGVHVKLVGTKTYRQIFEELKEHLEAVGFVPDEYFSLSTYIGNPDAQIPLGTYEFFANADWGGSEGIYINIMLSANDADNEYPKNYPFAVGKTLSADVDTYLKMSRIAAECQLMLSGGLMDIPEDIKNKLYPAAPRSNAGYTIIDSVTVNDREYVLGVNERDPAQYVTWLCSDNSYYTWGHYFIDPLNARKDLLERALEEINEEISTKESSPETANDESDDWDMGR